MNMFSIFIIQLSLLIGSYNQAYAAVEPLPSFQNEEEKKEFITQWQRQIPFSAYANMEFLNRQIRSLEALRKEFPNYDKWMEEKPDLIVLDVFSVEKAIEQRLSLEPITLEYVRKFSVQTFLREMTALGQEQLTKSGIDALEQRAYVTLSDVFKSSGESLRGLIVGLAQLLPPQERSAFFKLGDPHLQIDQISKLGLTDQALQQSTFRPEVLGLTKESLTFEKMIETARSRLQNTDRVFLALSYIKFLKLLKDSALLDSPLNPQNLVKILDGFSFDFAYKENSAFSEEVRQQLAERQLVPAATSQQQLSNFQSSFSRLRFEANPQPVKHNKLVARVFEVAPHLGTHRGCIGGDCSTSTSPIFPYSPWEHDFLIQNPGGAFLGYVSATRVLSDGLETFYLKDLSGAHLAPDVAEAILHAFSKIYPYYGAKQFAIAAPGFTDRQNHFSELIDMLKKYNRAGRSVSLDFPDSPIRSFIGANPGIFASSMAYDGVVTHKTGILFPHFPETEESFAVEYRKGSLPIPDIKSIGDSLLHALKIKAVNSKEVIHAIGISNRDLNRAFSVICNEKNWNLKTYYENVEKLMNEYQIEFTKTFINKHETLFLRGHLLSPDAFSNESSSLVEMSEKYFTQLARSHLDYDLLMKVAKQWKNEIEKSPRIQTLFKLYSDRLAPFDVFQLYGLSELGYNQAKEILKNPVGRSRIEIAIENLLIGQPQNFGLPRFAEIRNKPKKSIAALFHTLVTGAFSSKNIREFEDHLEKLFSHFGFDWREVQNQKFRSLVEAGFVRRSDSLKTKYRARVIQLMKNHIQDGSIQNIDALEFVRRLIDSPNDFNEVADLLFQRIQTLQSPRSYVETHVLHSWGYKKATELLNSPEFQKGYAEFLNSYALPGNWDQLYSGNYGRMANLYLDSKANPLSLRNKMKHLGTTINSIKTAIAEAADSLSINHNVLLELPNLAPLINSSWVNARDSMFVRDPKDIKTTLYFLAERLKTRSVFDEERFYNALDYLSQKNEFQDFVHDLENAFFRNNCISCGETLLTLITMGKIKDNISNTPEKVSALLAQGSNSLLVYGVLQVARRKFENLNIDTNQTSRFLSAFYNGNTRIKTKLRPFVRDWVLEVLMSLPVQDLKLQAEAREMLEFRMAHEPINSIALKMGLAYIHQGGNPYFARLGLTKRFPRTELLSNQRSDSNDLFRSFMAVSRPSNESGIYYEMNCKDLFAKKTIPKR